MQEAAMEADEAPDQAMAALQDSAARMQDDYEQRKKAKLTSDGGKADQGEHGRSSAR
jgi:hypothetical protein